MAENKVIYLFGSGATQSELSRDGIEVDTTLFGINRRIFEESRRVGGSYFRFHDRFGLPPEIDIEQLMSVFEIVDDAGYPDIKGIRDELSYLYRNYLIENIEEKNVEPKLLKSLLYIHRNYGRYIGETGEILSGIMTINFDSLTERAINSMYEGVNLGVDFQSDEYSENLDAPMLLKLHGSFTWKIIDGELNISSEFVDKESTDYTGWITPSVYKKPFDLPIFNEIWSNARNLLLDCDRLRIVGSSVRSEDFALISLLFIGQILNDVPFDIELIVSERTSMGEDDRPGIIHRLNFLTKFKPLSDLIDIPLVEVGDNIFYHWLEDVVNKIEIKFSPIRDDELLRRMLYGEVM